MLSYNDCKQEFEWFLNFQYKNSDNLGEKIKTFCHDFCFDDLYDEIKINELCGQDSKLKERYSDLAVTTNGYIDGDDTKLARMIYFLIHIDDNKNEYAIPDLKSFEDLGAGSKYKGDTINTYGTLFGNNNQGKDKFFTNKKERNEIDKFRRKYQTIGNFFILPTATKPNQRQSINSFRGTNKYIRDFFDLSMDYFVNAQIFDVWKKLPETKSYFDVMNNPETFIKRNFFEYDKENQIGFFDENNQVIKNFFEHPHLERPYHWIDTDKKEAKVYRKFALNFIKKSSKIIDSRAKRISEVLCKIYNFNFD